MENESLERVTQHGRTIGWMFWCPGCQELHWYRTDPSEKPCWKFNGSQESPTFTPSLRMSDGEGTKCHLFVTAGQIIYCTDCRHGLSGRIVLLAPKPEGEK